MDSFPSIVIVVLVITILFLNKRNKENCAYGGINQENLTRYLQQQKDPFFEDLFLRKLQDVSDKIKSLSELILKTKEEKVGFGSGITTESTEDVPFVSLENWEDERSPGGVSLQRSFPDIWSGEDGVYACYNLDPTTSSFTQPSISFLEKMARGLPGYDSLESVWVCGNAGRRRYHFTGTTPNFNILSANLETYDTAIQQDDLDYFQKSFDNARMSDVYVNMVSIDDGYNLPLCNASIPTRTVNTIDSGDFQSVTMDIPTNYFTQVGALTFANFNPDIAEDVFLGERGPQAWFLIKTFIKEIYNSLFTGVLDSSESSYSPPLNINYKECEINFVSALSLDSYCLDNQKELVTGLVVHKTEGITFYYNIDYRFDSSPISEPAVDIAVLAATDIVNQVIFNGNVGFTDHERSFDDECQTLLLAFRAVFPEYYATLLLKNTRFEDDAGLVIRKEFTYVGIQEVSFKLDNTNSIKMDENTILWKVLGDDKVRIFSQ